MYQNLAMVHVHGTLIRQIRIVADQVDQGLATCIEGEREQDDTWEMRKCEMQILKISLSSHNINQIFSAQNKPPPPVVASLVGSLPLSLH